MNFYVGGSMTTPSYRPVNGRIKNVRLDRLFIGLNSTKDPDSEIENSVKKHGKAGYRTSVIFKL